MATAKTHGANSIELQCDRGQRQEQAEGTVCPFFHYAVELIGRRWTGAILRALLDGATRFTDVTAAVPGLSDRLLSERLRELEAEGIVTRTVIPVIPVRVEYHLTEKGRALDSVLAEISDWATAWVTLPHDECEAACAPEADEPGSQARTERDDG